MDIPKNVRIFLYIIFCILIGMFKNAIKIHKISIIATVTICFFVIFTINNFNHSFSFIFLTIGWSNQFRNIPMIEKQILYLHSYQFSASETSAISGTLSFIAPSISVLTISFTFSASAKGASIIISS